jgi:outer membrane lipoprotein-sorting protein
VRRILGTVLALALAVAGPAFPAPAPGDPEPAGAPASLLRRLELAASGVSTLASDFVQEKHLGIFKTVVTSRGRFHYQKPDRLRWELREPFASGFALSGSRGRRWHQRTGRTESFDIRQDPIMKAVSDQIFAWANADFAGLGREYRIRILSENPVSLRLEPLSAAMAASLDHLRITFSPDGRFVRAVEFHEKDGDFTRIRFVDTVVNPPLGPDLFR